MRKLERADGGAFLALGAGVGQPFALARLVGGLARLEAVHRHFFGRGQEVGHVFGVVAVALGAKIAQLPENFEAHFLALDFFGIVHQRADLGIQVLLAAAEFENPGQVVDARALKLNFLVGHIDPFGQFARGALHAVAQADVFHAGEGVMRPSQHAHRIGVVEHERVGGERFDILEDLKVNRPRAQEPEHRADADGVGHGLLDAVFLRDAEFGVVGKAPVGSAADGDGGDDEVGAGKRLPAILRGADLGRQIVSVDRALDITVDLFEAPRMNVAQANGGILQGIARKDIDRQPSAESASRSDDDDLGHVPILLG
ncbi:MAG: hypothetical protein BWZ10_01291 [candidate division BRC1 bacterium ADurb.BinA364]|nr:MAG: hypothetical protein BWZ10_01291 [candidate division BRC1 bacterium ADurb.BinA364]